MKTQGHVVARLVGFAVVAAMVVASAAMPISVRHLGPIDDHQFVRTLFAGEPFGFLINRDLGRFYPLNSQEFVVWSYLFGPSAGAFYAINAAKVVACCVALVAAVLACGARYRIAAVSLAAMLAAPGFANASVRLAVAELNVLLLSLVFVTLRLWGEAERVKPSKVSWYDVVGVACLICSFFYKESVFILVLVFAISEVVRSRLNKTIVRISDLILIAASGAYLAFYLAFSSSAAPIDYAAFHKAPLGQTISSFISNDPIVFCVFFPLLVYRIMSLFRGLTEYSVFDSFLLAACAFFAAYGALRIYSSYYLLAGYGFGLIAVAGNLFTANQAPPKWISRGALFGLVALSANSVLVAFSDARSLVSIANNHGQFVEKLADLVWGNVTSDGRPQRIVLLGVSPGSGVEVVSSLDSFLRASGIDGRDYDILAELPSDNASIFAFAARSYPHLGAFKRPEGYAPQVGDVVVTNPYATRSGGSIQRPSFAVVFASPEEYAPARLTVVDLLRRCSLDGQCYRRLMSQGRPVGYGVAIVQRVRTRVDEEPVKDVSFRLRATPIPSRIARGSSLDVMVAVANSGGSAWPVRGDLSQGRLVHLAYVWIDESNRVALEGGRIPLVEEVLPGETARAIMRIDAPAIPGVYRLRISPVQEGVSWFFETTTGRVWERLVRVVN